MRLRYKKGYIVELNLDDPSEYKVNLDLESYSDFLVNSGYDKKEVVKAFNFINNINDSYKRYIAVPSHNNQGFKEYISIVVELIANYFNLGYDL